jgi:ATP-dependent 26S proteasome regulatory subunit
MLSSGCPLKDGNTMRFADVGGMDVLNAVSQMKTVPPFAHPELFKKYGKTAGGGILLYGPPGCGKTFFSRPLRVNVMPRFPMWVSTTPEPLLGQLRAQCALA